MMINYVFGSEDVRLIPTSRRFSSRKPSPLERKGFYMLWKGNQLIYIKPKNFIDKYYLTLIKPLTRFFGYSTAATASSPQTKKKRKELLQEFSDDDLDGLIERGYLKTLENDYLEIQYLS